MPALDTEIPLQAFTGYTTISATEYCVAAIVLAPAKNSNDNNDKLLHTATNL